MYFLGIETSCDETAAACLRVDGGEPSLVSELISSQCQIHELYGGVVPELASRAHLANLPVVVDQVLHDAQLDFRDLTAIGVTRGPGLKGCLLMGCSFAKGICLVQRLPLVGVNHIEAHIHAALLDNPELRYPFLSLVVSGGHTEILQVESLGCYRLWARTIDDAAGEAFDKSANLLGFSYPGGAALAELADSCQASPFKLPQVMREAEGFSFSGLKTAISVLIKEQHESLACTETGSTTRAAIAYAVQEAIVDALCHKLQLAVKESGARRVSVTGGVSANRRLRSRLGGLPGIQVFFPRLNHCMDNAAMVAYLAAKRYAAGQRDQLDLPVLARWPVEEIRMQLDGGRG